MSRESSLLRTIADQLDAIENPSVEADVFGIVTTPATATEITTKAIEQVVGCLQLTPADCPTVSMDRMSTQALLMLAEQSLATALTRQYAHDGEQVTHQTQLYEVIETARKAAFKAYYESTK